MKSDKEIVIATKIAQIKELALQIGNDFVEYVAEHENCSVTQAKKKIAEAMPV